MRQSLVVLLDVVSRSLSIPLGNPSYGQIRRCPVRAGFGFGIGHCELSMSQDSKGSWVECRFVWEGMGVRRARQLQSQRTKSLSRRSRTGLCRDVGRLDPVFGVKRIVFVIQRKYLDNLLTTNQPTNLAGSKDLYSR